MTAAPTTRTGSPTADQGWNLPKSHQDRPIADPSTVLAHHDCGSGWSYGICPACNRGHGYIIRLKP